MSKLFSKLNQRYREFSLAGFNQKINLSIVKATSSEPIKPKEKHLKNLLQHSCGKDGANINDMVDCLSGIFKKSKDSIVTLKSLGVFHYLIQKGYEDFSLGMINFQEENGKIFRVSNSKYQKLKFWVSFIKDYADFLDKRTEMYKITGIHSLKMDLKIEDKFYDLNEFFIIIKPIQNVLQAILDCNVQDQLNMGYKNDEEDKREEIIFFCIKLLLIDSLILYKILNKGMIKLFDLFFKLKDESSAEKQAEESINIYQHHAKQMERLFQFLDVLRNSHKFQRFSGIEIPQFSKAETGQILSSMKEKKKEISLMQNVEIQSFSDFIKEKKVNTQTENTEISSKTNLETTEDESFFDFEEDKFGKENQEQPKETKSNKEPNLNDTKDEILLFFD